MKIITLSGAVSGEKVKSVNTSITSILRNKDKHLNPHLNHYVYNLDLKNVVDFSDGRDIKDYSPTTRYAIQTIEYANGIIIVTPIYQASIPGTLKNLFDILPKDAFKDKLIGIVAIAGSSKHYLVPEYQLKPILDYMGAILIQKYVYIEESYINQEGIIDNKEINHRLNILCDEMLEHMDKLSEHNKEIYQEINNKLKILKDEW